MRQVLARTCHRNQALIHEIGRQGVIEVLERQPTQREETSRRPVLERRHLCIQEVKHLDIFTARVRNIARIARELWGSRAFGPAYVRMGQLPDEREKRRPNPLAEYLPYVTAR